jgi:hypothetical protein
MCTGRSQNQGLHCVQARQPSAVAKIDSATTLLVMLCFESLRNRTIESSCTRDAKHASIARRMKSEGAYF